MADDGAGVVGGEPRAAQLVAPFKRLSGAVLPGNTTASLGAAACTRAAVGIGGTRVSVGAGDAAGLVDAEARRTLGGAGTAEGDVDHALTRAAAGAGPVVAARLSAAEGCIVVGAARETVSETAHACLGVANIRGAFVTVDVTPVIEDAGRKTGVGRLVAHRGRVAERLAGLAETGGTGLAAVALEPVVALGVLNEQGRGNEGVNALTAAAGWERQFDACEEGTGAVGDLTAHARVTAASRVGKAWLGRAVAQVIAAADTLARGEIADAVGAIRIDTADTLSLAVVVVGITGEAVAVAAHAGVCAAIVKRTRIAVVALRIQAA